MEKYNLEPVVEMVRYEAPSDIAESLNRVAVDYALRLLNASGECTPFTEEANDIVTLRELRDAFRKMTLKED